MENVTNLLKGFGHGVERVIAHAIEHNDSDDDPALDNVPNVPEDQTFAAVHQRHLDFLDERGRDLADEAALEDVARGSSFFPHKREEPKGIAEVEEGDTLSELPPRNSVIAPSPFAHPTRQVGRDSLDNVSQRSSLPSRPSGEFGISLQRGLPSHSIEIGAVNPRNDRSAIEIGAPPRTESRMLGAFDEVLSAPNGRVVRRRVVLPYQITLLFGVASIVGVAVGIGVLVVSVRNAAFLRGPRAGPQLPEIKELISQALEGVNAIKTRLGAR